ncbi:MAG: hypothetical protein GC179_17325 [Anaerolineaceae bacterium]|nr:hypothetical protein [Anaerolineaceae bacterium]
MNLPSYISSDFPIGKLEKLQLNKRFPAQEINELFVDAQTLGNLMVYFDAEDEVRVLGAAEEHLLPERVEVQGSRLVIEAKNFKRFLQQGQAEKIRIEVHVPVHTRLDVHFGAGVLMLAGGEGDVHVSGAVGEISGYSSAQNITIKLRAGDVTLSNIRGQAVINMNLGSISLDWAELNGDENVEAKCDFGSIDLHLPPAVAVVEDQGGLFLRKTVDVPFSTHIHAQVGFGGLDTLPATGAGKPKHMTA